MKKLILLCVTLVFIAACSPEEDEAVPFHFEFVGVENAILPTHVARGYQYDVIVTYMKPTTCHYFQGFFIDREGPVIKVAPQTMVIETNNCQTIATDAEQEASFEFTCEETYPYDKYIFKFYQGEDQFGSQSFYEVEVPIVE